MLMPSTFNLQFDKALHQDLFKMSPGWTGWTWQNWIMYNLQASWWFRMFYMFTPAWGDDPIWLIFFKWFETTNLQVFLDFGTVSIAITRWGLTLPQMCKSSAISDVRSNIIWCTLYIKIHIYIYLRTPSCTPKHLSKTLLVQANKS